MNTQIAKLKKYVKRLLPTFLLKTYHFAWALLGAIAFNFPSKRITVIGVTGTKGKSSTIEFMNSIFEEAGYKTALASTIRVKIAGRSKPNMRKMTLPGRMFLQNFFSKALLEGCDIAFVEITSEAVLQYRHKFVYMNALVFTNISPEHIESHGSFEKYIEAKLKIGHALEKSVKRPRIMVANADDKIGYRFLSLQTEEQIPYSIKNTEPYKITDTRVEFVFEGTNMRVDLPGKFTLYNALAGSTLARSFGVDLQTIRRGLLNVKTIPGRAEVVSDGYDVPFKVVVDYAHTPDSLQSIYDAYPNNRKICVLGATGGGRDKWKRNEMGKIAEEECAHIILTNEDPYDEDPEKIIDDISIGIKNRQPEKILNRHLAIRHAIMLAQSGDVVLITGKGTDPYIMGKNNTKQPWSDKGEALLSLKEWSDSKKPL